MAGRRIPIYSHALQTMSDLFASRTVSHLPVSMCPVWVYSSANIVRVASFARIARSGLVRRDAVVGGAWKRRPTSSVGGHAASAVQSTQRTGALEPAGPAS